MVSTHPSQEVLTFVGPFLEVTLPLQSGCVYVVNTFQEECMV